MLDCPLATHTSPISRSEEETVSPVPFASTVSFTGPPAGSAGKRSVKRPSPPERAAAVAGPRVPLTEVKGSHHPQTTIVRLR